MGFALNPSDYTGTYEAIADHIALDFANTVSNRLSKQRHDWLDSYPNLLAWCEMVSLLNASQLANLERKADSQPRNTQNTLVDARQLREAIYALFSAAVAGSSPDPAQLNIFSHYLRRTSAQLNLG